MMLSLEHPGLCSQTLGYPLGIHCVRASGEGTSRIILKLPVSFLLPAKVNRGFKIYVVPLTVRGTAVLGLMCAFFDDPDSPLVCWRCLDDGAETLDLLHALTRGDVLVHLFDEQARELLGYRARVELPLLARVRLEHAALPTLTHELAKEAHASAMAWFGIRSADDDADAIAIRFVEALFPEDVLRIDLDPDAPRYNGGTGYAFTSLERTDPGPFQEKDIIALLQRVFASEQIYHAPLRAKDKKELADVVVVTDRTLLIVQAKDSPTTHEAMDRSLKRKKLSALAMLKQSVKQLKGAVKYVQRNRPLRLFSGQNEIVIDVGSRRVLSLAVVRELFLDSYPDYSRPLFEFFRKVELPCIVLDYGELHQYTTYCTDEARFLSAYFQVFNAAFEHGQFPRLRFGLNDAERVLQDRE